MTGTHPHSDNPLCHARAMAGAIALILIGANAHFLTYKISPHFEILPPPMLMIERLKQLYQKTMTLTIKLILLL